MLLLSQLFVYALLRFRRKNHLDRVRKASFWPSHSQMEMIQLPEKHNWKCPHLSLKKHSARFLTPKNQMEECPQLLKKQQVALKEAQLEMSAAVLKKYPVLTPQKQLKMSTALHENKISFWHYKNGWKGVQGSLKTPGFDATKTARNVSRCP